MAARRGDIGETTRLDFLLAAFDEEEMARICSRKDTVKNCRLCDLSFVQFYTV